MEKVLNPRKNFIKSRFELKDGGFYTDFTGTIITALYTACDLSEGIDGREILDITTKFRSIPVDLQELRENAEQDAADLVDTMFTSKDIDTQIAATLFYTDLVSRKVERNVRQEVSNNFISKLKKTEKAYEDTFDELEAIKITVDKAIKNETAAKEELSLVKKRADKQQRIAEHKISELEKEIERLRTQLNK